MDTNIALQQRQVISEIKYLPAVSIIMPFRPVVTRKNELEYSLRSIMGEIEQELVTHYPTEKAVPVIIKLKSLIRHLNFNAHTKSIAIFVSSVAEKVYYMELEVQEQVVFSDSYNLRHLVLNKKHTKEYIVMTLGEQGSKTYLGNTSEFIRIKSNVIKTPVSEGVANTKKNSLDEFLHLMDQGLSIIVKSYPLPVFVIGNKSVITQFENTTVNEKNIVHFIESSNSNIDEKDIQVELMPYELEWQKVKQKYLLNQVEKARLENKLARGIIEVWQKANQNKVRLLVLEIKYKTPKSLNWHDSYCKIEYPGANAFYIKDEIDDIIDLVLESGGDVEYVDENILSEYGNIVLVSC